MSNLALYNSIKDQMQTGDCLLWSSQSVVGWLIRKFSKADVNHAGLVIRPHNLGHFKDRRFTLEALEKGIILRLLSERLRHYKGKVYLYPLKDEYDDKRDAIAKWAIKQEGTPYDYKSLFKQAFARVFVDLKELFCSEICYAGYWTVEIIKHHGKLLSEMIAPTPGEMPDLGIFKDPVLIYDSQTDKR